MPPQWAAVEAREIGWVGIWAGLQATGMSRNTILAGLRELTLPENERVIEANRTPCQGGGRKSLTETIQGLLAGLESLMEPVTRGDPQSPLRWTCKSIRNLADEMTKQNHPVSARRWPSCCGMTTIACRRTARHGKVRRIRTAMRSSSTSMPACSDSCKNGQPRFPWTRKRRKMSGTSRMGERMVAEGCSRRVPSLRLLISRWVRRLRTAFTTCFAMRAG